MIVISFILAAASVAAFERPSEDAAVRSALLRTSEWRLSENNLMVWHFREDHTFGQFGAIVPMMGHWSLADGKLCHTFGHRLECWDQVLASKRGISAIVRGKRKMVLTPSR